MATVPIHEQALVQGGNSVFEDVWITDTLHYDFKRSGDVEFSSLSVSGTSLFTGDVTFARSLFALDLSLSRNANISGISTVKEIFVDGKLRDGDGNFGTSGQLLSSDGTDLVWINANTTSVANATNVGVNLNSDNSNQFISFFGASSGNQPNRVDADLRYNPSTNTMSGINYSGTSTFNNTRVTGITTTGILEVEGELRDGDGNFGSSGQILSSDGTDLAWINTGSLTAGAASEVGVTAVNTNAAHFITFVGSSSGNENIEVDTNLTYNPSTNVISSKISDISNHDTNDLSEGSSNLYHTTARARGAISASGDLNYNSSTGVMSFSAPSAFVSGMIIIWSGNTNNIPNGFVLCDGQNSTPDLRNRFIVGAGTGSGSDYGPGDTGGSADATLVSHSHTFSGSSSHSHTVDSHTHGDGSLTAANRSLTGSINGISESFATGGGSASGVFTKFGGNNNSRTPQGSAGDIDPCGGVNFNGSHTHDITGSTGSASPGTNSQTVSISGTTNEQGSSATNANLPPYYALCYIMKT